jgi:hypothetical protein
MADEHEQSAQDTEPMDGEDYVSDTESGGYPDIPEWAFKAWRMWLSGVTNWSAIARAVGVTMSNGRPDGQKVKRHVDKLRHFLAQLRKAEDIDEATEDYIEGKTMDLHDADKLLRTADNDNARVSALKTKTAIRESIAEARGVATKSRGNVVEGEPVQIATVSDVLAVIERAVNDAQGIETPDGRARTLGYLSGLALRAVELTQIVARIEALEEQNQGGRQAA